MANEDGPSSSNISGAAGGKGGRKRPLDGARALQDGLALYKRLDKVVFPGSHHGLVMGHDHSHFCDSLMYGELSGATLRRAFQLIEAEFGGLPTPGDGSLFDIGSGIGKQVFTAACLWPWKRVAGIEIYERRHKLAVQALGRWNAHVAAAATATETEQHKPQQQQQAEEAAGKGSSDQREEDEDDDDVPAWEADRDPFPPTLDVSFQCADVVEEGAAGYEVLLLVSAAFTDALLQTMAAVLDPLPVGTLAICITKGLPSPKWAILHDEAREEPWGRARLIIQRKAEL